MTDRPVIDKSKYIPIDETPCACCGRETFTPLRREDMGGYVCLPCVNKRLDQLSGMVKKIAVAMGLDRDDGF